MSRPLSIKQTFDQHIKNVRLAEPIRCSVRWRVGFSKSWGLSVSVSFLLLPIPLLSFFGLSFSRGQNRKSCSSVFLCSQRSQSNIRKSNPIELQSFDWLRLGSVIKLNRTHPKIFLIEHNRTLKKSNIIRHCMQQSNIKPVSSGFSQKGLRSNKLYIGFNFKHEYPKMSQGQIWKREQFWKQWLKATKSARFAVNVSEKFIIKKKRGDPALKVTDNGCSQLGHLQRELVPVLWCFPVLIVNLSILNHFNNKDFS